jgi:hypothetical protein
MFGNHPADCLMPVRRYTRGVAYFLFNISAIHDFSESFPLAFHTQKLKLSFKEVM